MFCCEAHCADSHRIGAPSATAKFGAAQLQHTKGALHLGQSFTPGATNWPQFQQEGNPVWLGIF